MILYIVNDKILIAIKEHERSDVMIKKPYVPLELPFSFVNDTDYMNELIEAHKLIAVYQTLLNKTHLKQCLIIDKTALQEAIYSSKIEGAQATLDDVLESESNSSKRNNDIIEIENYADALRYGEVSLKNFSISLRFIKELHKVLLSNSVRCENRSPGQFRSIQNFIGPQGCTIKTASYIPPEPQLILDYMSNLDKYINDLDDSTNDLIRAAIIHAQFETIHPFLDGNGRIGRILIPLYFSEKKLIDKPVFFLSKALEKDRYKYYTLLNALRVDSEESASKKWRDWIKFFINAVILQANENIKLISDIDNLYDSTLAKTKDISKSSALLDVIDFMFEKPIFTKKMLMDHTKIKPTTANNYLNLLIDSNIIYPNDEIRNKTYYFYDLINILR